MFDPKNLTRPSLLADWQTAVTAGTFLTFKHDIASVGSGSLRYRTVSMLSQPELQQFLNSGEFDLRVYENHQQPKSPLYIEIVPRDATFVAGSGIQANSGVPTDTCNRFIAVSGTNQGWHLFAERDVEIERRQKTGDLSFLRDVR